MAMWKLVDLIPDYPYEMKGHSHHISNIAGVNPQPECVRPQGLRRHLMGEEKNDGIRLDFEPKQKEMSDLVLAAPYGV